jgi:iron(III) transport system substrate-binding protein
MTRVALLIALIVCGLLVACDRGPQQQPVVVYLEGNDEATFAGKFAEFTDDTGIPVTIVSGESSKNADRVINNSGSPPADMLLTNNVADIWRAADEGALRPIGVAAFSDSSPELRDPDGFWVAAGVRSHAIAALKSKADRPLAASFDQLASGELRGRVCLSSSALPVNRSLIAMLINDRGVKKAERLVRGWIRNLAVAPFSSEDALITAIRNGTCEYGVLARDTDVDDLLYVMPEQGYTDIDGMGVARHARQAESAQRLIEWLVRNKPPRSVSDYKLRPVAIAGWRDPEARLLAERAGYH